VFVGIQKQKQTKEEYGRKLQELQSELASSNELRQRLERKVCTQPARRNGGDKKTKVIYINFVLFDVIYLTNVILRLKNLYYLMLFVYCC
jgi:hypothetical protein